MGIPSFIKMDGNSALYSGSGELVFYVPEVYFERGLALLNVDIVELIGIFDYAIFEGGKPVGGLKPFYFPSNFATKPYKIEYLKGIKLTKNTPIADYRLFKYKKDDTVIISTKVPQHVSNIENFIKLLIGGTLPNTIPYNKLHEYVLDNINLNGASYFVHAGLVGVVISEICRDINDRNTPFRLSGSKDMSAYSTINIKDSSKLVSPFTALTGENWNESVANAIINKNPKDSPLESLFVK